MRREVKLSRVEHAREVVHYWRTKEGLQINIRLMDSQHLLNTIHLLERSRFQSLSSLAIVGTDGDIDTMNALNYYNDFPEAYEHLLDEAERRRLIKRSK